VVEDISLRIPFKRGVSNLDPGKDINVEGFEIISQIFAGLIEIDPQTSKPVPDLAESFTESADGTRYVFKLRKNLKWSNGNDLTAHDVVWSIRRNLALGMQDQYAETLAILKNAKAYMGGELKDITRVGVHALADDTVEFELAHGVPYFTSLLRLSAFKPLPREVLEQYGENWTDPLHIVTSGPYTLASWKKDRKIILKKNPFYYDAANVRIPEIHCSVIPEESMGLGMYKNDELDILGGTFLNIPKDALDKITGDPALAKEYSSWPHASTYAYCFNSRRRLTDDIYLRKAIASVIDRNLITGLIMRGGNTQAHSFVHPLVFGSAGADSDIAIAFDPDAGRRWLTKAGYKDGNNVPEIELLCVKSDMHLRLANAIKQLVKHHLNIRIKIIAADWNDYFQRIQSDNPPHMFSFYWFSNYPDPNNFFKMLSDLKIFPDPLANEFKALIDKAGNTMKPDTRNALYLEAEMILCRKTVSLVPIFYGASQVLVKPRVKEWSISPLIGQHFKDWRLEK
jgi:ABC-type oligopeptide transport system substrate-binding subunit